MRMYDRAEGKPFADETKPGRLDVNGNEWWACDPYPTWFRRENGIHLHEASPMERRELEMEEGEEVQVCSHCGGIGHTIGAHF